MAQFTQDNAVTANIQLSTSATVPASVKNVSVGFPGQPGALYAKNPETDMTTIDQNYVTAEGIKLQLSDTGAYSNSILNNGTDTIVATLSNSSNLRLFAMPVVTIYEGTAGNTTKIPEGSGISPTDWEFSMWIDWGDSDNNNIVHKTFVKNVSGSTKTIVYRINFRYIVEEASV